MNDIIRVSPVVFKSTSVKTEKRDNWDIVLEYSGEGDGPCLIDLSHKPRFDYQDSDLSSKKPFGLSIPEIPGCSVLENGFLANRMNQTQVSLFNLNGQDDVKLLDESGVTDVTESTVCVALIGKHVFSICEKLTALDFMDPARVPPFLFQGPFSHIPCQIITLSKKNKTSGLILTCSRGYGEDIIHSILHAGKEFGMTPAGENRFTSWINEL